MNQDSPTCTFYSIIAASIGALVVTHFYEIPGEDAMPIFMGAMALGVVIGEVIERMQRRSKAN